MASKMQKHELDLETLLALLEEMRQNGILFTNLPPGLLGQKTGCQVRIDLVEGKVVYCHIEDSTGQIHILDNDKAFSSLYGLGTLKWYVETGLPDVPPPADTNSSPLRAMPSVNTGPLPTFSPYDTVPLQNISSIVPRKVINVESSALRRLSRSQRRVLILVDGTRSVEKIASMLYSSSEDNIQTVLRTLRELEMLRLITMDI